MLPKWIREFSKNIADYFNKHWIQKTIILFFPTIWLPVIVRIWGDDMGLSKAGVLTKRGSGITVLILGVVLLVNILSSYRAKLEKESEGKLREELQTLEHNLNICETVMDSIYDICDAKYDTLLEYMAGIEKTDKCEKPFLSTVQPTKQLKAISDELASCFNKITGIKKNELIVSMAYRIAGEDAWRWVDFKKLHGCATLKELMNDQKSTFYQIYSGKAEFLFFNSKEEAEKQGMYTFDKKDNSHRNAGSIICQKIEVGSESSVQGVIILSISSYGKKFIETDEKDKIENVENTVRKVILKQFEKRICIELSDLYIKDFYSKYKTVKSPNVETATFNGVVNGAER